MPPESCTHNPETCRRAFCGWPTCGYERPSNTRPYEVCKLSICPCGFSLFKEHIKIGTVYYVNPQPNYAKKQRMQCGGCNRVLIIELVPVWDVDRWGWIPGDALKPA